MKNILIIEGERSIAQLERDYLEINGFSVEIESSGETGLKRARSENFDLIILDLMLPKIDGFEICKQIRREKDIPILMVSARNEDIDKIRGLELDSVGDVATITVHIRKLREKIELDPSHPQYIETIWGVGYRFQV
jgi:DNA-binding response OmpR family regulator